MQKHKSSFPRIRSVWQHVRSKTYIQLSSIGACIQAFHHPPRSMKKYFKGVKKKKKKRFQFDQTRFCLGFKTLRPNGGQLEMMCTAVMAFVVMMGERGWLKLHLCFYSTHPFNTSLEFTQGWLIFPTSFYFPSLLGQRKKPPFFLSLSLLALLFRLPFYTVCVEQEDC